MNSYAAHDFRRPTPGTETTGHARSPRDAEIIEAVREEREECARVADAAKRADIPAGDEAEWIAAAIRARD